MRHVIALTLAAVGLSPAAASAQFEREEAQDRPEYWYDVFYPKLFYTAREGFGAGIHVAMINDFQSMEFSNASYRTSVALNAQFATEGSRSASLVFRAPARVPGWRFFAALDVSRQNRDPYHGIGNDAAFDSDNVTDTQPRFYQAQRDRFRLRGEVQRQVAEHVRVLAGFNVDRTRLASLGTSVLSQDLTTMSQPGLGAFGTDAVLRFGLVVDTRDSEVAPLQGVFLEAIFGAASRDVLSDVGYTRTTLSARGYLPVTPRLTLAGRAVLQGMTGTPGVTSYYLIEESDDVFEGIGGSRSHRAVRENRLLGRNKVLANAEARVLLFGFPGVYALTAVGFVDAGRVFEQEEFRATLEGYKVGGGAGLIAHLGARLVFGGSMGVGPDGVVANFHTQWPF